MDIAVEKPPVALIAGPTASGKSALALVLADRTGGVVINADSAQLYRDLPILSAAPSPDDLERAEHRLYGIRDGANPCSAAEWASLAKAEIEQVHGQGRLPILVGGTGLYLRTLLDGIAPVPAIDPGVREEVRATPVADNHNRLAELDAQAASKLNASDTSRVARALEVVLSTGEPLSRWQERRDGGIGELVDLKPLVLLPPRDWLYRRCDARFATMITRGAAEEVRTLLSRRLDPALPVMRAIGVRETASYLSGAISLGDAVLAGQQSTRRYAKRQYTWFAHQPPAAWPRWTDRIEADLEQPLELLQAKA